MPKLFFVVLLLGALAPAFALAACGSRTGLQFGIADSDAGTSIAAAIDAGDACGATHLGAVARTPTPPATSLGTVVGQAIDLDHDALVILVLADDSTVQWASVDLATGSVTPLTTGGDSNVIVGACASAAWDGANHRIVVLGGESPVNGNPVDPSQVYALRVQGTVAQLSLLPDFPGSTTTDLAIPAVVDPARGALYAVQDKGSTAGPVTTYALDLTEGAESWSMVSNDAQPALASVQMATLMLDAPNARIIGLGATFLETMTPGAPEVWALPLAQSGAWTELKGDMPFSVGEYLADLSRGLVFAPDDEGCGYVTAFSDDGCLYEAWRMELGGASFTMSSLGVAVQPNQRAARGPSLLDTRRQNFVFAAGFECENSSIDSDSTDFVPLLR